MKRWIIAFGIVLALTAGGLVAWRWMPDRQTYFTDAGTIREPAATAHVRDVLWEPPVPRTVSMNTEGDVYEPRLTNDAAVMYFVRGKAGKNADIYFARKIPGGWSDPESMSSVNTEADELGPEISADGDRLYFYSNRAGGLGGYDLWISRRGADREWREPVNLGPEINSSANDYGPALTPDGRMLYFSSNRPLPGDERQPNPDAWPATLREQFFSRTYDLYSVQITDSGAARAQPLAELNTPHNEGAPALGAFGDFLYFASDRPGGEGGFDLYRSRRLGGGHRPAENLGMALNTVFHELDPALSMNGFGLDFSSDRPAGEAMPEGAERESKRTYKLYHTNSREVFVEHEQTNRPPIDWAAMWRAVAPNLLWALLALTLLMLMLLLFKGAQNRKLSLLARCLLASLAAHLLLMLLMNVWEVAASLAGELRRGGAVRVALTSPASQSLAAQITGSLSQVEAPEISIPLVKGAPVESPMSPGKFEVAPQRTQIKFQPPEVAARLAEDASPPRTLIPEREISVAPPEIRPEWSGEIPSTQPPAIVDELRTEAKAVRLVVRREEPPVPLNASNAAALQAAPPGRMEFKESPRVIGLAREQVSEAKLPTSAVPESFETQAPPWTQPDSALTVELPQTQRAEPLFEPGSSIAPPAYERTPHKTPPELAETWTAPVGTLSPALAPSTINADAPRVGHDWLDGQFADASVPAVRSDEPLVPAVDSAGDSKADLKVRLPEASPSRTAAAVEDLRAAATAAASGPSRSAPPMEFNSPVAGATQTVEFRPKRAPVFENLALAPSLASEPHDAAPLPRAAPAQPSTGLAPPLFPVADVDLNLPSEQSPPENPYPQRSADDRMETVRRMGGSEDTERAVALALQWLAGHQSPDGHWDAAGFDARCGDCDGQTHIAADHALTGLGLLCFLGAGHTHHEPGPYQDNVRRALHWLTSRQRPDGDLRGPETMYSQGIAAIALAEAYAMSGDQNLADPVFRAARFIYRARNPQGGGWRYDPGQPGDTSVLGWQVMALKSALRAGVIVPEAAFSHARTWLDRVSRESARGLYSYQPGAAPSPSMTAEGLFAQQLLGLEASEPRMRQSVDFVLQHLPNWDEEPSTYFWYYASLALFQHQGEPWRIWNTAMSRELIEHQRKDDGAAGSWDPSDEWSRVGGRVYQTALCTLMLEVYYRYLPMYGENALAAQASSEDAPADDLVGIIRGRVTDAASGEPLEDVSVRLDLSGRPVIAQSDSAGRYSLRVPAVPDYFALSASRPHYVPRTHNVERARLETQGRLTVDFALEASNQAALVTEAVPDVHHLGDDNFGGAINSQFQKRSEGSSFETRFTLDGSLLDPLPRRAEIRLLVKGVQRRHRLLINEKTLQSRLDEAPEDGSFGEFTASFDPSLLVAGVNTLKIVAAPSESDIDDFEFINIRVYLIPATDTVGANGP